MNGNTPKVITVFGSSRPAEGHGDYGEAVELGRALAEAGFAVCTGGYSGVMEGVVPFELIGIVRRRAYAARMWARMSLQM